MAAGKDSIGLQAVGDSPSRRSGGEPEAELEDRQPLLQTSPPSLPPSLLVVAGVGRRLLVERGGETEIFLVGPLCQLLLYRAPAPSTGFPDERQATSRQYGQMRA